MGAQMSLKREQLYKIGLTMLVLGFVLNFLSFMIIYLYLPTLSYTDFFQQTNVIYFLTVIGVIIAVIGVCLMLYTKHPYYANRWTKNKI